MDKCSSKVNHWKSVYCFYNAFNIVYRVSANGNNDLRDVFILVFSPIEIRLAFSVSLGPNRIKWATRRLPRSLSLYGDFEEEKEIKLSLYITFEARNSHRKSKSICSFLSLPILGYLLVPLFLKVDFLSLQNESLKPV